MKIEMSCTEGCGIVEVKSMSINQNGFIEMELACGHYAYIKSAWVLDNGGRKLTDAEQLRTTAKRVEG